MAFWIDDIKNDLGITVIMIEHDMSLVSAVSDRVLALNNGRMLALGTPARGAVRPGGDRGVSREGRRHEPATSQCATRVRASSPPHSWGRDRVGGMRTSDVVVPPPLTPPHKGEGNRRRDAGRAMTEPILSVRNLETYYGPITAIRGVSFDVTRGPDRHHPGRQRRGQDHGAAIGLRRAGAAEGHRRLRRARHHGARARLGGAQRHRPRAGGARDLPVHDGEGQPDDGRLRAPRPRRRRARRGDGLRLLPGPARARRHRPRAICPAASSRCWRSAAG